MECNERGFGFGFLFVYLFFACWFLLILCHHLFSERYFSLYMFFLLYFLSVIEGAHNTITTEQFATGSWDKLCSWDKLHSVFRINLDVVRSRHTTSCPKPAACMRAGIEFVFIEP